MVQKMELIKKEGGVCAPKGFKAAGMHAGIRGAGTKNDLMLIVSDEMCSASGVYTTNKVYGAPITVTRENIKDGRAKLIVCNSGIANTCAPNGIEVAKEICELAAEAAGCAASDVIVASTGVIGEALNIVPFKECLPVLAGKLSYDGSDEAAKGIMTTDTVKKETAVSFTAGGKECTIGAIAKGSGMINPNMATMLAFITTDCAITPEMIKKALAEDVKDSFNQLSVDGDTSTNDMAMIMANGLAGNELIDSENDDFKAFCGALHEVTAYITKCLAADGEGASKLITCNVSGAPDKDTARKVAKSVVSSDLLKAAVFGEDANWGRILCAVGYTDADFSADNVDVDMASEFGRIPVCRASAYAEHTEEDAAEILRSDEILIDVDLNDGEFASTAWGCDLTYDYVKINGDYRS